MMSGVWKAEKAFFQQYNQFTSDLVSAGYRPEGTLFYTVGFNAADSLANPRNWFSATALDNAMFSSAVLCTAGPFNATCEDPNQTLPGNTATPTGIGDNGAFVIGSSGDIGGTTLDHWTLDENKDLINTQDGL